MATHKLTRDDILKLPPETIKQLLTGAAKLTKAADNNRPTTDDELHAWIKKYIGVDVPRNNVCHDHDPPFKFIADLFFERVPSAMLLANRGGGKTWSTALVHFLNATYKPGYWGLSFGASDAQSDICYSHLKNWVYTREEDENGILQTVLKPMIDTSIAKATNWKNGSRVTVVTGSKKSVNGPHPNMAHADEIDQMDDEPWDESRNMAVASRTRDDLLIPAQDVFTSTRKSATGRMQQLIDQHDTAIELGHKPAFQLYKHCTFETTAEVPNCRGADPEAREKRLTELNMDPCSLCDCNTVVKGKMPDDSPRTLDKVCDGRFFQSRGWRPLAEVQNTFQQNSQNVWEAQQECSKPSTEGNYLPFDERKQGIRYFEPDPDNGPIYMAVDWGGTNPHAVNWYQRTNYETQVESFEGKGKVIPAGSFVCFDEIYVAEIGINELATRIKLREGQWRQKYPTFRPKARFADPQGKAQRIDFRTLGLPTEWHGTRDKDYQIQKLKDLFFADLFYVDVDRCPMFVKEIGSWREEKGREVEFMNHAMSNFRYCVENVTVMERFYAKRGLARGTSKNNTNINQYRQFGQKRGPLGFGRSTRETLGVTPR